jgi:tungstate transport system substrate-binding protein
MKTRDYLSFCLLCVLGIKCVGGVAAENKGTIRLAATTSILSSGLLHEIETAFEADTQHSLEILSFGTGRALRCAVEGNVDVLIVHSPEAEQKFMRAGYGLSRTPLMNDAYLIAGPEDDPAGVTGQLDAVSAFNALADQKARFISRGDDSGTHRKELEIWERANIVPYGKWYIEYGYGMGKTLSYADKMSAYVLVDRGTWLAMSAELGLKALFEGDALLDNPYHIIAVNPAKHPSINHEGAKQFIAWMTSKRGRDIIQNLRVDDQQLYTPAGDL